MIDQDSRSDELIDTFLVDIDPDTVVAGLSKTTQQHFNGTFGFSFAQLSFQVECMPGFVGENCISIDQICNEVNCNNGTCQPNNNGFTCSCVDDFNGERCETKIDDCQNVNCNNGMCVDGVLSFVCQCDDGYSGSFCDTTSTTASVGLVAGAVVGSVTFVVFIIITVVGVLLFLARRRANTHPKAYKGNLTCFETLSMRVIITYPYMFAYNVMKPTQF